MRMERLEGLGSLNSERLCDLGGLKEGKDEKAKGNSLLLPTRGEDERIAELMRMLEPEPETE